MVEQKKEYEMDLWGGGQIHILSLVSKEISRTEHGD